MNGCVIFYFSGTGNTAYIAKLYKENFEAAGIKTDIFAVDSLHDLPLPDVSGYDYIGFAGPIYAFSLAESIRNFISTFPEAQKNQKAFLFTTCGGLYLGALIQPAEVLKSKKFKVLHSVSFKMPSNMPVSDFLAKLFMIPPNEKLYEEAYEKVKTTVKKILEGNEKVSCQWGWLGKRLTDTAERATKNEFKKTAENFMANDKCNSCQLCVISCPAKNIKMIEGRPGFQDHCLACYRCYNICPKNAIIMRKNELGKPRYLAPGFVAPIITPHS